jgi:hypothetical protein
MVWDINFDSDANVVEVAIKRLRAKLDGPFDEKLLHTIRGMGYVLESRAGPVIRLPCVVGVVHPGGAAVFLLIGGACINQVDKGLDLLPQAELDARFSVLESTLNRYGTPEHWAKIINKLNLLAKKTSASVSGWSARSRLRIWPAHRAGPRLRRRPAGMRDLRLADSPTRTKCWSASCRRRASARRCVS